MKAYLSTLIAASSLFIGANSYATVLDGVDVGDVLTGDTKLACEATLCLAGSTRPGECVPSLTKYFNITKKKWKDTLKARRNFLKLCPASDEQGMPELTDAIVGGAGRCEADTLNRELLEQKTFMVCRSGRNDLDGCQAITKYRISPNMPSYCKVYFSNEYTDFNIKYSGVSEWQTKNEFSKNPKGQWVTQ